MKKLRSLCVIAASIAAFSAFGADAASNWSDRCAKCHGTDGKGQTKMGKKLGIQDYTDAKVQASFTNEEALAAIRDGRKDKGGKTTMKAVEGLSPEEMQALVKMVRSFKA